MSEIPAWTRLARQIAGSGLTDRDEEIEIPEELWPAVAARLRVQKLTGLAAAMAERGTLRLSPAQVGDLLEHQHDAMLRALDLERRLLQILAAFEAPGIESVVLKGPAVAHTMYPDPAWRPFGDLDLLVRARDWRAACALLPELGYRRVYPEPRPGFTERFGHTALHSSEDGAGVDLHRTLIGGAFGLWMDPDELFEHVSSFDLGGRRVLRLDDSALFLHACVHASLGYRPPLLLPLRDVAQIAVGARLDHERLGEWGRRWRLGVVYEHALEAVSRILGVRLGLAESHAYAAAPSGRRERRALEAYTTERRDRGAKALSSIRAIPGIRGKAAYVGALLFPSREFLASRPNGQGAPSYWKRWAIPLRRLVRALVKTRRRQTI